MVTLGQNCQINAIVKHSKFVKNRTSSYFASAILCYDESEFNVLIENCFFLENTDINNPAIYCAAFSAGGYRVNTRINNCLIAYNGAAIFAGGYENSKVLTEITNCTFFRNGNRPYGKQGYNSFNFAGAIYYNKMNFYNCVIWEPGVSSYLFDNNNPPIINATWFFLDYCMLHPLDPWAIQNFSQVFGDSVFIGEYPEFMDTTAGDFRLKTCSPAMDRGDNQATINAGLLTDLDGLPRIRFGKVDIGAYETQDSCFTINSKEPNTASVSATLSPNPASPGSPLDIQVYGLEPLKIDWTIWDAYGRALASDTAVLVGVNSLSLEAPRSPGIYFIELNEGLKSVWLKLLVQ